VYHIAIENEEAFGARAALRRNWQVIEQVERRGLDALGAQEDSYLGGVAHLVKHDVPQQAVHREALPWPVCVTGEVF